MNTLLPQLKGKKRASGDESFDVEDETRAKAIGALVAMVEIWMSDLWSGPLYPKLRMLQLEYCSNFSFEDEAETTCDNLATLALETDPTSCEALQTIASVRMSQKRPEEAQHFAERAWERWKGLDSGMSTVGL